MQKLNRLSPTFILIVTARGIPMWDLQRWIAEEGLSA